MQFICTAPPEERSQRVQDDIDIDGILTVQETVTSERNLSLEVVAIEADDLATIIQRLSNLDLLIHSSKIIINTYTQPFEHFERTAAQADQLYEETT